MTTGITYFARAKTGREISRYSRRHLAPIYKFAVMGDSHDGRTREVYTSRIDLARNIADGFSKATGWTIEIVELTWMLGRHKR